MSFRKSLLVCAAVAGTWAAAMLSASAQTSGIGSDEFTRLAWRGTDNSVDLWQFFPPSSGFGFYNSHAYGPYTNWTPVGITTLNNNDTYVLWQNYDGTVAVWKVDTFLNFITSRTYGPYSGWTAKGISADTTNGNQFGIIWKANDGSVSVWRVDQNLNFVGGHVQAGRFGWDPAFTSNY